MKITVVGSGGWGTALAILLHNNGHTLRIIGSASVRLALGRWINLVFLL